MDLIANLVPDHIRRLEAYTPGVQPSGEEWIKLNTNELPYSPPESVRLAITREFDRLARYPNPRSEPLREALAKRHLLDTDQVIIGNGSDDLLNLLVRAFGGNKRKTVDTFPSYSLYPVLTAIAAGEIKSVPLVDSFELPLTQLINCNADLLFLTCPNAPTGIRFAYHDLEKLAKSMTGLLVIDEAYVEFAEESALPLLNTYENVVLTRTFSKAYGLAGLRVGYALASASVISILDRIRDSYNVNRLSQAGALAALAAEEVYGNYILEIKERRERVRSKLMEAGWTIPRSETNFLFAAPVRASGQSGSPVADDLYNYLEARRILVRYFPKHPLTAPFLRISIGSELEMKRFMEEVDLWQKGA